MTKDFFVPTITQAQHDVLQEAYDLLSPIPKTRWITGNYTDGKSKCCTLGHLRRLGEDDPADYSADRLDIGWSKAGLFVNKFIGITDYIIQDDLIRIHHINDGGCTHYQQPTPKARVIAFLTDALQIPIADATPLHTPD